MENFCLKEGQGLKASAAHLYPNSIWVHPPGLDCSRLQDSM